MKLPELAKAIVGELKGYVDKAVDGAMGVFSKRLEAVEQRQSEKGEKGDTGAPGQDGATPTHEELIKLFEQMWTGGKMDEKVLAQLRESIQTEIKDMVGPQGEKGEPGQAAPAPTDEQVLKVLKSMFSVDRWNGNKKGPALQLLEELVAELPKPEKGEKGDAGAAGEKGDDGATPTEQELKSIICKAIQEDPIWVRSVLAGEVIEYFKANPVKDGVDGKDAAQIDILPRLDIDKSVSRGTYALHAGGLWRSFQKTHGLKGWECIVDGIADIQVDAAGERGVEVVVTRSAGETIRKAFELPVMIYRGVFTDGTDYAKGDTVTWDGSLWHCNEPTKEKPTAKAGVWTLATKRGRDGRDGNPGEKGEPGKNGVDGKVRT